MPEGTVEWFDKAKGYGFIKPDGGGKDIFVHYSDIAGQGFRSLAQGQRVTFGLGKNSRGQTKATEVHVVDGEDQGPEAA